MEKIIDFVYEKTIKTRLEEIYYGEDKIIDGINESEEYKLLRARYDKNYEDLFLTLKKEQTEKLKELNDLMELMEIEIGFTNFKEGFKFCMQLVLEGSEK